MRGIIKSAADIEKIAAAGALVSEALRRSASRAVPGARTSDVAAEFESALREHGGEPLLRNARSSGAGPFPGAACVCINDHALHAPPGPRAIEPGDLVTIDGAASVDGWCADAAVAVVVGRSPRALDLRNACRACIRSALDAVRAGVTWSSVAVAARESLADTGFSLVPGFDGHGIGRSLHEPPRCWLSGGPDGACPEFDLRPGMVLTLEPVVVEGSPAVVTLADGWTVATLDGGWACHEEITIVVCDDRARVLTPTPAVP